MNRCTHIIFLFLLTVSGLGCRAYALRSDQDKIREAVLDLYTNQIMDNLIRAQNGFPIVQLDYTNMTGTITQDITSSAGNEQTLLTERDKLFVTTLRRFSNLTKFSLTADDKLQLTITSNPVINNNEVYNAYLEFLSKPERLVTTCEPPQPGQAHIVRCSKVGCCEGKRYYWVPCEFKYDFLRLALVTTVQRGQPLSTPEFFENTVTKVVDDTPDMVDKNKQRRFIVYLRKRIPNDDGILTATLGGELYNQLNLKLYTAKIDGEVIKRGDKIDRLWMVVPVKDGKVVRRDDADGLVLGKLSPEDFRSTLEGQTVRIDLNYYRPTNPTTEDLLQAIRHEVGLIRLEQAGR